MSHVYILQKGKETIHTYSKARMERLKKDKWKHIISVSGWNMSITHLGGELGYL